MNKILTALKFFKDHTNNMKTTSNHHKRSDKKEASKIKEKENVNDKGRDSVMSKEGEIRPRTSRGKRSVKQRRRSGSKNNSALGFHSKMPHHLLNHGVDVKGQHNRSVNIANDSPRTKSKRKINDRISPNMFAPSHQK